MPEVIQRDCAGCGQPLEPLMASLGLLSHPGCSVPEVSEDVPVSRPEANPFADGDFGKSGSVPLPQEAQEIKAELLTIVRWFEEFSPRSQQVSLGPSDLGLECDRALAYKVAGIKGDHVADPWPASVGSAIHTRLEKMITRYYAANPQDRPWQIERRIKVDELISGRADLVRPPDVVDIKTAGADMMKQYAKKVPKRYLIQINAYAYGLRREGVDIQRVSLAFFPRSGWLKDLFVWTGPYDESLALEGVQRPYILADQLRQLDVMNNPHRWEQIPAEVGFGCQFCSMHDKYREAALGADDKGCPGWGYREKKGRGK